MAIRVKDLHRQVIEYVAESDNALMERFFEQDGLSEDELRAGLHQALEAEVIVPVFAVSGLANIGVSRLLDHIAKYESSPMDHQQVKGRSPEGELVEVNLDDRTPVLFVFKTMNEPGVGELSLFRVYAGEVVAGQALYNPAQGSTERVGQLYFLNGHKRTPVTRLQAGDIGAAVKLRDTHTGNTLCDAARPVLLPQVNFPTPNIHTALGCESRGDDDKFAVGLTTLSEEDPSFHHRWTTRCIRPLLRGRAQFICR